MLQVVCFSHKRQLQLHGYLESLFHHVPVSAVTVIYPPENDYSTVRHAFPHVTWIPEIESFDTTVRGVLEALTDPFILFGCDDVTYTRRPTLEYHTVLSTEPNVLGYSLRLGHLIKGAMALQWKWTEAVGHWAYPFELTGTIYRTRMVQDMLSHLDELENPNHFEYVGTKFHQSRQDCTELMRGFRACLINQNVNQVQDAYNPNSHQGTACTSLAQLDKQYANGRRLNWQHANKAEHDDVWTGMKFWKLTKKPALTGA